MEELDFKGFCARKAFEISYAVFRIAENIKKKSFADNLEEQGLAIMASVAKADYKEAAESLGLLENLMRLGMGVSLISVQTADLVIHEARILNAAIAEYGNAAILPDTNLLGVFSEVSVKAEKPVSSEEYFASKKLKPMQEVAALSYDDHQDNAAILDNAATVAMQKAKMRQSEIVQKMKESDSWRLKDIQEHFPHISERTLRYDLQKLTEQGLLERIGPGGPATFYRAVGVSLEASHGTQRPRI